MLPGRAISRRAALARTPDLLDLAGVVAIPSKLRGADWDHVERATREARHGA